MELRDHPLMSYRGIANWPPVWTSRGEGQNRRPRGEVGTLREVFLSAVYPHSRLFLIMELQGDEYMGCLLFSDRTLCQQIYAVLMQCVGMDIADIGGLDLSHLV